MIHHIEAATSNYHGCFSKDRPPILTVDPGDTIVTKTLDAGWGLEPHSPNGLRKCVPDADRIDPEHDQGHCLVGPIAVRGAEPGSVLAIEIDRLTPGPFGGTFAGGAQRVFNARLNLEDDELAMLWDVHPEAGAARNRLGHVVKLRPFLGVLGLAPAAAGPHSTIPPRRCGGNLDCKELVPGSTLYLPVEVAGALLGVGDGHAAQGDGEVCGTAIECPMDHVEFTLHLHDDFSLKWPRARTPAGWMTFGFDEDLTQAMLIALNGMLDLLMVEFNVCRREAAALASVVVDLRITQIVNVTVGVHAVLPHGAIENAV